MGPKPDPTGRPQPAPDARTRVPFFVPLFNPVAQRLLGAGFPLGPNALLTVRGRKTGVPRTTPVALVLVGGRRWIIGTFGEVNWVQNLRAAGEATLRQGSRREPIRATELTVDQTEQFFANIVGPYVRRVPLGRLLLGSLLRARDIIDDPAGAARRHPVFELVPASEPVVS
jgi:deazaflavin-dependent oxidoreductase (nitroreductase family)